MAYVNSSLQYAILRKNLSTIKAHLGTCELFFTRWRLELQGYHRQNGNTSSQKLITATVRSWRFPDFTVPTKFRPLIDQQHSAYYNGKEWHSDHDLNFKSFNSVCIFLNWKLACFGALLDKKTPGLAFTRSWGNPR